MNVIHTPVRRRPGGADCVACPFLRRVRRSGRRTLLLLAGSSGSGILIGAHVARFVPHLRLF